MSNEVDLYERWLQIPAEYCPPNHYVLLDVEEFTDDITSIDAGVKKRTAHLHQLAGGPNRKEIQRLLGEVAVAKRTLLNAEAKIEYDQWLSEPDEEDVETDTSPSGSISIQLSDEDRSPSRKSRKKKQSSPKPDQPRGRRRKPKSAWDAYKLHLASASVLLLIVLGYWYVNRGGAPQAAALPEQPSQRVLDRGAGFRPQTAASQPVDARTANTSSQTPKRQIQKSKKPFRGGLDTSKMMQAMEDAQSTELTPTASEPKPAKAESGTTKSFGQIKLPAKWDNGLTEQKVFTANFEKTFQVSATDSKGYRIEGNKLWLEPISTGKTYTTFLHNKKRVTLGDSIAIETNMKKTLNQTALIGLELSGNGVTIKSFEKGIKILKRVQHKQLEIVDEIETNGGRVTILLTRDSKRQKTLRWTVIAGEKNLSGEITSDIPRTSKPKLFVQSPGIKMQHKLWISNFRTGKLAKPLPK